MRLLFLACPLCIFANQPLKEYPWFTGPLLAESGEVLPPKALLLQPYLVTSKESGMFILNPILFTGIGICKSLELRLQATVSYKETQGVSSTGLGDVKSELGIQVSKDYPHSWRPDCTFGLIQQFPTGKYQRSSKEKKGTDLRGSGSYQFGLIIRLQKLMLSSKHKCSRIRLNVSCVKPTQAKIKGISAYGGGSGTSGDYTPGIIISSVMAIEQKISQRWGLAIDISNLKQLPAKFIGTTNAFIRTQGTSTYSVAPALEYNLSEKAGFIGGVWQSLPWGRSRGPRFTRYIISFTTVL